jgi:hypothetical protein
MSDIDDKPTIDEIITSWKDTWGPKFPERREDRIQEFLNLFDTCKSYGYTKKDFLPSMKMRILNYTINENSKNKKGLSTWKKINTDFMEGAFVSVFVKIEMKVSNIPIPEEKQHQKAERTEKTYDTAEENEGRDVSHLERLPDLDLSKLPKKDKINEDEIMSEEDLLASLGVGSDE